MEIPKEVDIKMTDDGDIDIFSQSDSMGYTYFNQVDEIDFLIQNIKNRIKTCKPDWFYDEIGANMESILGMENSKDTALYGAQLIEDALIEENFIKSEDIYIRPIPSDVFSIVYFVAIRVGETSSLQFKVDVALNSGVNIKEVL